MNPLIVARSLREEYRHITKLVSILGPILGNVLVVAIEFELSGNSLVVAGQPFPPTLYFWGHH